MDNKRGNKTPGLTENDEDKQYDNTVMTELSKRRWKKQKMGYEKKMQTEKKLSDG